MDRSDSPTSRGGALALSPPDESVVRQASGEQAAAYIRRLIFDGELRPGTRLPQDQIAKALGVSRIPVREAVVALEREGWVNTRLHKGAFINTFNEDSIRDHYELLALIYGLAVKRTISRHDPEVLARMAALARQVGAADEASEVEKAAHAFHSTVVEGAHSRRMPVLLKALSGLLPGRFFELVPAAIAPEQRGEAAIVRHARKGDGEGAADDYSRLFRQQAEAVVDLFRRRNLVTRSESI